MKPYTAWMLLLILCSTASAAELISSMQSDAEAAQNIPAGAWQGNWIVTREDPRIRTRGGAEALRLNILQDAGSDYAQVQWLAGPAICGDPLAEACEWIGASGESLQVPVTADALYLLLPISADQLDPFLLHLHSPRSNSEGLLLSFNSGLRYRVRLSYEPDRNFTSEYSHP